MKGQRQRQLEGESITNLNVRGSTSDCRLWRRGFLWGEGERKAVAKHERKKNLTDRKDKRPRSRRIRPRNIGTGPRWIG